MDYGSLADDFFVNLSLQTTMPLPGDRESVLHFYETVQRQFPSMTGFFQRETGEFVLEGDRDSGTYRWLELSANRLAAGHFNPPSLAPATDLHRWLLERSIYFLGVNALDVDSLDILFGFNLDYVGNRDAIVAQAMMAGSPLGALLQDESARCVECEPSYVITLDPGCQTQARLHIETHSNSYQVRTGEYEDEPISIYLTVRQYPQPGKVFDLKASFEHQCELCEELVTRVVLPNIVQPISSAIATGG